MESSEMLDVIYVFFEEDMLPRWEQDLEIKNKVREVLYRSLHGREYKYGFSSSQGRHAEWGSGDDYLPSIYGEPLDGGIKPYFPPTSEDELQGILGAPMGE